MKSIHNNCDLFIGPLNSISEQVSVDIRIKLIEELRNQIFFIEGEIADKLKKRLADLNEIKT
jgi:hypothetical protein